MPIRKVGLMRNGISAKMDGPPVPRLAIGDSGERGLSKSVLVSSKMEV
jgi:hypothetical protein